MRPKLKFSTFFELYNLDPKIEDLVLVSRKQLAIMNKRGYKFLSKETTETGMILADVISAARKARRKR